MIWQPRCTADASSRMRNARRYPSLLLIIASVTLIGGASHITLASYMTPVSVPVPVASP